jgi:3-oxoacyl-[acyl-carrier-protein] synthase III
VAVTVTDSRPTAVHAPRLPVGVSGIGVFLPEEVVTNDDWAATLDTSDEWIRTRTGIQERRRAAPDVATSDLAVEAGRAALQDAGLSVDDVDAVIVATTTPDHLIPQTAPLVATRLGIAAPAFDVGAGCTGFVYGLAVAGSLVTASIASRVLLIGAETLTRVIDPADRETAVLFGDGAGAVVLAAGGSDLGPFDLGAQGDLDGILFLPAGGVRQPASHEAIAEGAHTLKMRGREVYRHAVTRMSQSSLAVLEAAGLEIGDVDLFVGHQANARILQAVASRIGIDDERAYLVVDRYGNTSAASIPIALADARAEGLLETGTRVLLTAFGAGLTWGSCVLTWGGADGG